MSRRALLVSKAMLALALVAVVQGDAKAAFPGANGLIVFQSNRDSPFFDPRFDIYVMNADGSGQTRLTTEEGSFPAWSHNGSKIAFTSERSHQERTYTLTYQAEDAVGNMASCQALVVVPKSQGH